jgi:hypothetical protein
VVLGWGVTGLQSSQPHLLISSVSSP